MEEKLIEKEIRKLVSIHDTFAISGSPNVKDDDEWISLGQAIFLIKQKEKETRKKVEYLEQELTNDELIKKFGDNFTYEKIKKAIREKINEAFENVINNK